MQNKISTPVAAAAIAGVLLLILVIGLVVRNSRPAAVSGTSPASSAAYTHPGPGSHP